uniref:uncharacterized protein LOC120347890 n=1 Tax=Styela clava TaxID=7725 RepID=UPI001939CC23|nr:uncharacterized protein LOC120347890 [Styela clava]
MYKDIDAVTDFPACCFWEEIYKAFPDSKIILMIRDDEESWFMSAANQIRESESKIIARLFTLISPTGSRMMVNFKNYGRIAFGINDSFLWKPFSLSYLNEQLMKLKYRAHNAYVLQNAPPEELLVFKCSEGWEPLCKFLDVPVPDLPFPHKNKGLGSTDNENIALRRNHRELELLCRKQKMLGIEKEYVMKIIDLNSKSTQVNYRRLTKKVSRIKSHLTEDEIKEMENDVMKKEFADKYRKILHQTMDDPVQETGKIEKNGKENDEVDKDDSVLPTVAEQDETDISEKVYQTSTERGRKNYSQTSQGQRTSSSNDLFNKNDTKRPKTCPNLGEKPGDEDPDSADLEEIIPSLESLLDQLHNVKPQQFYENQRKLKLYDIRLLHEELEAKKKTLFRNVDAIINWDKKKDEAAEEEEARRKQEEEENKKPKKRRTTFMRSVLRNFSMELMMKTMQHGWTDLGKCRYLRKRPGDDDEGEGTNTLAAEMRIKISHDVDEENPPPPRPKIEPGFGPDGKMIRTADLLGLKSYD